MQPSIPTELRCPRCSLLFYALHPHDGSVVAWFPCPNCGQPCPSLPTPREPPLFSWEVYRHFYPEPSWPIRPNEKGVKFLSTILTVSAAILLVLAAIFLWIGIGSTIENYSVGIHGQVVNHGLPMPYIMVSLNSTDPNSNLITVTNASGYFAFANVGQGEHTLRFVAPGFQTTNITIFLSPYFQSPGGNATSLVVGMVPGSQNSFRAINYASLSDLETYLTIVLSTGVAEAIAGLIALWGAMSLRETKRPPRGVVGSATAFMAPLFPMTLSSLFPMATGASSLYTILFSPSLILAIAASGLGLIALIAIVMSYRPFLWEDL